jgi:hypothetical protein
MLPLKIGGNMALIDPEFKKALARVLNKYSIDSETGTPDFILADYITEMLYSLKSLRNNSYIFENEIQYEGDPIDEDYRNNSRLTEFNTNKDYRNIDF